MFLECLAHLPSEIDRFPLAPPARERAAWEVLPASVRSALIARGAAVPDHPYPPLPASRFMDFRRSGDRSRFEAVYMARRRHLNALVLAECVEHAGRFLDPIIDGIYALCEESGWQLPAHNTLVRDTPTAILPDPDVPVLDLFACETGAQLALVRHLLGAELDAISPIITARIDREIGARIVEPYLTRHFWWMGNGDEPMCNWTAWCTQNVLLTVLGGDHPQALRRQVVEKAAASLDAFLKDYAEDGCCEEGAQYYRHAALCLFNAADVLDRTGRGAFAGVFREAKIRNMAEYIVNIHVRDGVYFNFADCSPRAGRAGVREFLFGRAVGSPRLMAFAAADWRVSDDRDLPDEINLYYRVQAAFAAAEIATYDATPPPAPDEVRYGSVGLVILRDATFDLAIKGGDNGDSHGHADTGSVILYKDGQPVLIDIGVESYTAKTFSASRHEIWTIRSAYHNLPVFDGVEQGYGAAFGARDLAVSGAEGAWEVAMDIAPAYPPHPGLASARRTVRLARDGSVTLTDRRSPPGPSVLHLILARRPEIEGACLRLPGLALLEIEGGGTPTVEVLAIEDPRLRLAWPERLYRVAFPFDEAVTVRIT